MQVLPPGTILQLMYLKERLQKLPVGTFIEIGPGSGDITSLLLSLGWTGIAFDLNPETTDKVKSRFKPQVDAQQLSVKNDDFLNNQELFNSADLIISCMVMEHFDNSSQDLFINHAKKCLTPKGIMIGLVPASPTHWGIEDDIAGHYRRYTVASLIALLNKQHWQSLHIAGLTYPLSNLMLPLSNFLVTRKEKGKLQSSMLERTKLSGNRKVLFKTYFPNFMSLVLNKVTLMPFHLLQKLLSKSSNALVIYFEASPTKNNDTQKEST